MHIRLLSQRGFSLLEIMIVILIFGFFLLPVSQGLRIWQAKTGQNQLDDRMDEVRSALSRFVQDDRCEDPANPDVLRDDAWCVANGYPELANESVIGGTDAVRFPCPADPTLPPGDPDYGQEARNVLTGACTLTVSSGVIVGAIPAATIGVPASSMIDPFGNKYTYAVSADATTTDALLGSPTRAVEVDNDGTLVNSYFALLSHGQTGIGAYTAQGQQIACASGTEDAENCNGDEKFVFKMGYYEAQGATFYDDKLAFSLVDAEDDEWWYATDVTSEHITHKNAGNVGVGSASPILKLHVKGDSSLDGFLVDNDVGQGMIWAAGSGSSSKYAAFYLDDDNLSGGNEPWVFSHRISGDDEGDLWLQLGASGSRILAVDPTNTNIGVKRDPHDSYTMDIAGDIRATTYLHSSDERLKKNIVDLETGTLSKLMQLRTVKYELIEDEHGNLKLGVIAQNLREQFPELVSQDHEGFLSVDYPALNVPAIKALQELKISTDHEIKSLKEENEALRATIEKMEARLLALEQ